MPKMSNTPPPLDVEVTHQVHNESRDVIIGGLLEFNRRHLGESTVLDVYVRDANGQTIGGLVGDVSLGWLSIHALWVAEHLRGSGIGANILKTAEDAAIKSGCHSALLDTLSFQAPGFYEKRGYVRVGVVDGYRGGAQKLVLRKPLLADS
jgi:GNAT superfamily N-acetyltransferase